MSTYLISDIHGALEQFMLLLSEIGFDPADGRDELYLLGDYADWGNHRIRHGPGQVSHRAVSDGKS